MWCSSSILRVTKTAGYPKKGSYIVVVLFFCQIVGGLFFLDALFGLFVFFDCGFHFSFLSGFDFLLFVCLFFLMFLFAFFKKCSSSVFYGCFSYFFGCFLWGGDFHGDFFCCFFFHSLWRFDDFYCLYLIWHSMGSAQCVIYVRHQISESTICTVVGTFLILKAINYFLCFCFLFSFGSVRGGRSR